MKFSQLIVLTIISMAIFYIMVGNPKITQEIYIVAIALTTCYGAIKKEPNVMHIALILLLINLLDYFVFAFGIIDLSSVGKNRILHGSLVYGIQLLISIFAIIILILRVQISRAISRSSKIELTYFDGLFHWVFIYLSLIYILALIENLAQHALGWDSMTLIYHNFESLVYIGWAVSCALLLTMVMITEQNAGSKELNRHS
ncbi:hypothetical protein [Pseudoalteromonas byunsanensis]|uniref:Uncharacterized protein n=1 Tax=Pseudoalteromonas byunsanensis TaxID=327939 RepID=A0A1S1MY48_9GAMM|nr:hypothetical protein [Pseudoalteromonas byunsanensis]OHU93840.1 hypothetical protein BIW53_16430 [Pseudoalteromonas byunsanensis]